MILILTQCFPPALGGIEIYMGSLANALHEAGHDVTVLADQTGAEPSEIVAHDHAAPYPVQRFKGWKPLRRRAKAAAVRAGIAKAAPSHIIADSWKSLEHLSLPSSGPLPKIICLAHGMEFPAAAKPVKRKRIVAALDKADAVFANSRATADLVTPFLSDTGKAHIVTPPIAAQPEPSPSDLEALSRRLGLSDAQTLIATVARLEPRKGIDDMIRSMARLKHIPLVYAVAGAGVDLQRLTDLAEAEGVADRVHFLGAVTAAEKAALLSRADVFAMPTRRHGNSIEGFGIVYLEAGWYGTPAIAGRDGGAADAVLDGITGLVCDPSDLASLDRVLTELVADVPGRTDLGDNARRHAHDQLWQNRLNDFLT